MTVNEITYGSKAASQLEPYLPEIAHNFELPRQIGGLIAAWDRPEFMPANQASHMRDGDQESLVISFCAEPASLGLLVAKVSKFQTLQIQTKVASVPHWFG